MSVSKAKASARERLSELVKNPPVLVEHGCSSEHFSLVLDIDETIADIHRVMMALYNKKKGTHYTVEDHKDWDFKSVGSGYVEMMSYYVEAWKNHWEKIPFMGNRRSIVEIAQYFPLDLDSSRGGDGITDGTDEGVYNWAAMHKVNWMGVCLDITRLKKIEIAYTTYIDDSPKLAEQVMKTNEKSIILIRRPYNEYIPEGDAILKVNNVNGAAKELISIARELDIRKTYYQSCSGQRLLREGYQNRDKIVSDALRLGL